MHGKNFENFEGTDTTIYKNNCPEIESHNFGFDILFEKSKYKKDFTIRKSILEYWTKSKNTDFFKSRYIFEDFY